MKIYNKLSFRSKQEGQKGFTLIESLVLLFIFGVISIVFLQVIIVGSRIILDSKNRLGAVALANQKMEIVRSIEYDIIGTKRWNGTTWVYGIPAGDLIQEEDISINTKKFHVSTFVQYVDDPFDKTTSTTPADTIPTDYKRVRIEVSWGTGSGEQVTLFGNFTPNGLETAVSGGTLSVNVLRADGLGVVGADVNIRNNAGTISVNATTDATGNVTLPGTPAGSRAYIVTVSKANFFGANTFPSYPTTAYIPVDVNATVVANKLNQVSIVMDQDIDMPLKTVTPYDEVIPSVNFSFIGGRILGTNPNNGLSVVTVNDTNRTTDSNGEYTYRDQSYGLYTFSLIGTSNTQFELYKILPETGAIVNSIDTLPGSTQQYKAVLLNKNIASLKVSVVDNTNSSPLINASVRLRNADSSYDVTGTTDRFGFVFFPVTPTPLVAGTYTLTVNATGYREGTKSVTVGTTLVKDTIRLIIN